MSEKVKIQWYKSAIGRPQRQKDTVRALGFTKLNQTRKLRKTPEVLGMIRKIPHLVRIVEMNP